MRRSVYLLLLGALALLASSAAAQDGDTGVYAQELEGNARGLRIFSTGGHFFYHSQTVRVSAKQQSIPQFCCKFFSRRRRRR
jgi:hypothetical protein